MRYLPNAFQIPNVVVDRLACLLTDPEYKVLSVMIRCILGYSDKIDDLHAPIRQSFLMNRTGKCKSAIIKACKALERANIVKVIDAGQGRFGTEWELNLGQLGEYDWPWLEERQAEADRQNRRRTAAARKAVTTDTPPPPSTDKVTPPTVDNSVEIVDNSVEIVDNSVEIVDNSPPEGEIFHTSAPKRRSKGLSDRPQKVCPTDLPSCINPTSKPNSTRSPPSSEKRFKKTHAQAVYNVAFDFANEWQADTPEALAYSVVHVFDASPLAYGAFYRALYEIRAQITRSVTRDKRPGAFLNCVRSLSAKEGG